MMMMVMVGDDDNYDYDNDDDEDDNLLTAPLDDENTPFKKFNVIQS